MPGYRVVIVSDDEKWSDRTAQACARIDLVPERIGWSEARGVDGPPVALVLDIDPAEAAIPAILERWAADTWYPVCIISLRPTQGAWETQDRLEALGYRHFLYVGDDDSQFDELQSTVQSLIDDRCWLVPRATRAVGCSHPAVVEALSLAVIIAPEAQTVDRWANELGLKSPRRLEALFAECRVRNPARVFQWLRLARVIEFAAHQPTRPTRDKLARLFGYGSGDYLGKRARALTALALGKLLSLGLDYFFELMARRLDLEH